jgi:hypothetical protein
MTGAAETIPSRHARIVRIKSVSFRYEADQRLSYLLEDFRRICNGALQVAFEDKPYSRFKLIELAYPRLKEHGLHSHYVLSACEAAYSIYKNENIKSANYYELLSEARQSDIQA